MPWWDTVGYGLACISCKVQVVPRGMNLFGVEISEDFNVLVLFLLHVTTLRKTNYSYQIL